MIFLALGCIFAAETNGKSIQIAPEAIQGALGQLFDSSWMLLGGLGRLYVTFGRSRAALGRFLVPGRPRTPKPSAPGGPPSAPPPGARAIGASSPRPYSRKS